MKKVLLIMKICVLSLAALFFGCTKKDDVKGQIKVAMVTDVGGVNDQSFNQSAWEGLTRAKKELGVKVSYMESKQDADYLPNLETLFDAGNDLIWGIGFKMADRILEAAKANPGQKYAIIDYSYGDKTPPNVVGVLFKEQECAFLAGYVAAKMSKVGTIGFVGGMDVPVIHRFKYGFMAGVLHGNPEAKIIAQYAASFTDAAKGKAIANQMFKNGADIIFQAAGSVGDGVIEAAKEKNLMAIGVDRDQNDMAPQNVVTSAMKRVDNAIFNVVSLLKDGKFPGEKTIILGLKEKGVGIAPTSSKHVPANILEEVEGLKKKIISGEITTPPSEEAFNIWKAKQ